MKAIGLTAIYNLFHDPTQMFDKIVELRRLHDRMELAMLDAYGWHDLRPVPAFFPEFDEEEDEDGWHLARAKPKKHRYRWPDEMHDEVLARLLALNLERAALQHPPESISPTKAKRDKVNRKPSKDKEQVLF